MATGRRARRTRIFLFDLDGTLIWSGGAGVRALELAFAEVFRIRDGMRGVVCDGKTDRAIVREVLSVRGLDEDENIERLLRSYVGHLSATVAAAAGYRVIDGVPEALAYLRGLDGVVCGLATGNVLEGARAKLGRADLFKCFPVGGFGSDAEDRSELVRIGVRRARDYLRDPSARAVVIGDTPRDILAAHAAGVRAVGVATGNFDPVSLAGAGADLLLESLARPEAWVVRLDREGQ